MPRAERTHVVRDTTGPVTWEIASRPPAAALRPYIRDFCGYSERGLPGLVRRTEFPGVQVETLIERRLAEARELNPVATWLYHEIERHHGNVEMRRLARESGYSPTHLIALFRDHVGFAPKLVARITRFERFVRHLRTAPTDSLASLAARFGYYDQAHLVRDMHQFAGMTPTQARAMTLTQTTPGGAMAAAVAAADRFR